MLEISFCLLKDPPFVLFDDQFDQTDYLLQALKLFQLEGFTGVEACLQGVGQVLDFLPVRRVLNVQFIKLESLHNAAKRAL